MGTYIAFNCSWDHVHGLKIFEFCFLLEVIVLGIQDTVQVCIFISTNTFYGISLVDSINCFLREIMTLYEIFGLVFG